MLNNEWNLFSKRKANSYLKRMLQLFIYIYTEQKKKASCNQQVKVLAVGKLSVGLGS